MFRRMKNWVATLRNAVDYPLRKRLTWRRPIRRPRNEPKEALFHHLSAVERDQAQATADRLYQVYRLDALYNASTRKNYRENLFYLELLEAALTAAAFRPSETLRAADVGPSHWFYVRALYQLLRWWKTDTARTVALDGFEIDPYRVYADFHSRFDHAVAQIQGLAGVVYHPEGVQNFRGTFDLVLQLFPFVFVEDHLDWGLPRGLFGPDRLLGAAWEKLDPGGTLIVVNQGETEHQEEQRLMKSLGIDPAGAFRHDTLLFSYDLPRYVLVARKADDTG